MFTVGFFTECRFVRKMSVWVCLLGSATNYLIRTVTCFFGSSKFRLIKTGASYLYYNTLTLGLKADVSCFRHGDKISMLGSMAGNGGCLVLMKLAGIT